MGLGGCAGEGERVVLVFLGSTFAGMASGEREVGLWSWFIQVLDSGY